MNPIIETDRVFALGDNVDTDVIIPARYLLTTNSEELGRHCLEDLIDDLAVNTGGNGVVIGGRNFGSGSSREHAPIALMGAGVRCVAAESFSRIFFRNSFNIGLPLLVCPGVAGKVSNGDALRIDISSGRIENRSRGIELQAEALEPFMMELLHAGGLVEYTAARLRREGRS